MKKKRECIIYYISKIQYIKYQVLAENVMLKILSIIVS